MVSGRDVYACAQILCVDSVDLSHHGTVPVSTVGFYWLGAVVMSDEPITEAALS